MIYVTIKPMKTEAFRVPAEPADTILDLKLKVAAKIPHEGTDPAKMTLTYLGKILTDEVTIEEIGISIIGFLVLLPVKADSAFMALASESASRDTTTSGSPRLKPSPAPQSPGKGTEESLETFGLVSRTKSANARCKRLLARFTSHFRDKS
mmetsp:Transcript_20519/g.36881  ORF Transcript_20519/g.36881 Transcript_20519/m.36881 type:complete len:151 (-) Transcript_20519:200-652(-)|eukprot:CAMPEP_0197661652 /NCGR_PEP_ID=MMETSP1338-20131121/51579_1 /TAXON_ID=43686 ORGANISM="Pelagodinium beii, Strain RCC1491" /NCGR_SAMPLE_ID=MMETSP1338 /ASSEMBLY_ACC=CAM_ASM_000754 /LENGTH=150 /DNA_ID=CAMNT_0043239239 /DNA_START=44 /DNA_END=496 /DNA_ORIENTATION=-